MDPGLLALSSGLLGALLGGAMNYFATIQTKRREWHLGILKDRIAERQKLYSDFLCSSSRLVLIAVDEKISDLAELDLLYNEMARIELLSTESVVDAARKICDHVICAHAKERKENTNFFSVRENFVSAVRMEIEVLSKI